MRSIDATDARILNALQRDAKLTNVELSERVGLSPSPCLARVKALSHDGIIKKHVTLLDAEALGLNLNVFIQVSLTEQTENVMSEFAKSVRAWSEVLECHLMTGDSDYLLRVVVADVKDLRAFILDRLTPLKGVAHIRSSISLEQVKYETALPV